MFQIFIISKHIVDSPIIETTLFTKSLQTSPPEADQSGEMVRQAHHDSCNPELYSYYPKHYTCNPELVEG